MWKRIQIFSFYPISNHKFSKFPSSNLFIRFHSSQNEIKLPSKIAQNSFYKRPLPSSLEAFSSPSGKKLFKDIIISGNGHLESYWTLIEHFQTQSEPAYCGLAVLSMVLNALKIDPKRLWKPPWRWFSEDLLDCCAPLHEVKKKGITFNEFSCLAKCNGAEIRSIHFKNSTEEQFRKDIITSCSSNDTHMVISFSRATLGQTGDGHFAAIGGYHAGQDKVLILDTAKFKYPAFWCPVSLLFKSMEPIDKVTGQSRGYFLVSKGATSCSTECQWDKELLQTFQSFSERLPEILNSKKPSSVQDIIRTMFNHFMDELNYLSILNKDVETDQDMVQTKLFSIVSKVLEEVDTPKGLKAEKLTFFLFASPSSLYKELPLQLKTEFFELRNLDFLPLRSRQEVIQLRNSLLNIGQHHCSKKNK